MYYRRAIQVLFLFLVVLFGRGCGGGGDSKPVPGAWHAISVEVQATTDLNQFQDAAHSLSMYVVQMSDVKDFTKAKGSMSTLLEYIDKGGQNTSVTRFQQIVVQPGQMKTNVLDRIDGSNWVAVIFGFYYLDPEKSVRLYQLPSDPAKKLSLSFTLGPDSILDVKKN